MVFIAKIRMRFYQTEVKLNTDRSSFGTCDL